MNDQPTIANSTDDNDFAALFNYPALGQLFDSATGAPRLAALRARLNATIAQLERVQRQGSQQDAGRAERIVYAYRTTLVFLDELESLNTQQQKS